MARKHPASLLIAVFAALIMFAGFAQASPIQYRVSVTDAQITLGGNSFTCDPSTGTGCATVTITAIGNTATVQPFSVPGAHGFTNALASALLEADVDVNGTFVTYNAKFLGPIPFFAAVDNANQGAGFGSAVSPTYPEATFGPAAFATYDLASDFFSGGFWGFCPNLSVCASGPPLATNKGDFTIIPTARPAPAAFESTLIAAPEPDIAWPIGASMALVCLLGRRRVMRVTRPD